MAAPLPRRLFAEFLGSAFLTATVIGSGIAAANLSPGNTGLQLLENALATAAGLFTFILMFGPVSGAHFNSVVSLADAMLGGLRWRHAFAYIPAQLAGCIAGAIVANLMFDLSAVSIATTHRASSSHLFSEVIATFGLLLLISPSRAAAGATWLRPRSAPTSAPPTSSPARRASPTRRSTSAACSPTPSRASLPPRSPPSSSPSWSGASLRSG